MTISLLRIAKTASNPESIGLVIVDEAAQRGVKLTERDLDKLEEFIWQSRHQRLSRDQRASLLLFADTEQLQDTLSLTRWELQGGTTGKDKP